MERKLYKYGLDKKIAESFVYKSIQQAKDLVSIGILKTNDNKNFFFKDNFAREILFKNFDKSIDTLKELNKGIKTLIKEKTNKTNNNDLLNELKNFNIHYKNSNNLKFIEDMGVKEKTLLKNIENKFINDSNFRADLKDFYNNENIDPLKREKLSLIFNNESILNNLNQSSLNGELKV